MIIYGQECIIKPPRFEVIQWKSMNVAKKGFAHIIKVEKESKRKNGVHDDCYSTRI